MPSLMASHVAAKFLLLNISIIFNILFEYILLVFAVFLNITNTSAIYDCSSSDF